VLTALQADLTPPRRRPFLAASVIAHIVLLAAIVFHSATIMKYVPEMVASGSGDKSYHIFYLERGSDDYAPVEVKHGLSLAQPKARKKGRTRQQPPEQLQVPADAELADHNSRAGSMLGTVIDGPITGHEVRVAYPTVFPDPPVARAELPPDLKGDVVVEVTIDSTGAVVETRIIQSIGHGIDEKIVATLRQWHFQPATLDGTPVASKHDVHFHFPS
jgi:TonB family protein